jgi:uncharacterized protein with NRDE domain
MLKAISKSTGQMKAELFQLLQNEDPAPDERLPHTGVSLEWERMLSPLFIKSTEYGTRSSTVLFLSEKKSEFFERVFQNHTMKEQHFTIEL